ncbi:peptidoglycan/xylan/chitin deacetylase (PgdA/CDA1 family) [Geodermatophilus normandii]|uniref:Peptidoglycan/xylan/chitin deacetylase (PgdA/CDA1 family) n=1 Tax=Geodermatophilus normandii TaxID=1137989 RepID=A0A317QMV0_9ACTN|nr:peptidoglycan/xylan/chitin deacetylase (PgdA/CDA1 family) [Geodermatophilus normandii]
MGDGSSVAGLVPHQETVLQPDDQRGIATVTLTGVDSLGQVLTALVDAEVRRYEAARRDDGVNVLTVGWGLVQATGDVLGVRVTSRSYTGGAPHGTTTTTTSVYTDVASGETWTAAELVADPERLAGWVTAALGEADLAGEPPDPAVVASDVRFGGDGSLTVVLDRQEAGLRTLDAVAVRVPAADADDVLSGPGRRVRDAALDADGFRGVPAEPPDTPAAAGGAVDCTRLACIALTFDDGPGPYTADLLDELADAGVPATFFVLGGSVAAMPDLVRRAAREGHALGSHTWSHPHLPLLTAGQIADEVDRTTAALRGAGVTTDLMRPPYGETDARVGEVVGGLGYAQVLWDVDTQDWLNRDVATTTRRALEGAHPGGIVLMHDIHPTTVEAVPGIIDALRARGYTLVTVPQLLGAVEPGGVYRGG